MSDELSNCDSCDRIEGDCDTCHDCGECVGKHPQTSDSGREYCEDCYGERFTSCDGCGDECETEDVECHNGESYCRDCYNDRFACCNSCSETVSRDYAHSSDNGDDYCESCYYENFGRCDECHCEVDRDSLIWRESRERDYCESCDPGEDSEFEPKWFNRNAPNTFTRIGSRLTFGVELETSECEGYSDLDGSVYFGAKEDGSIEGMEFVSAVLQGDRGLDAIDDFCRQAADFSVDASCGFHLHIGCQDFSEDQLYAILAAYAATQEIWRSFVPDSRRNGYYVAKSLDFDDIAAAYNDGQDFSGYCDTEGERYYWLNRSAYNCHKTLEVRLHTATLNAEKINNWVAAHLRFVEAVANLSIAEIAQRFSGSPSQQFAALATIIGPQLADFYRSRAAEFGTRYTTDRQLSLFPESANAAEERLDAIVEPIRADGNGMAWLDTSAAVAESWPIEIREFAGYGTARLVGSPYAYSLTAGEVAALRESAPDNRESSAQLLVLTDRLEWQFGEVFSHLEDSAAVPTHASMLDRISAAVRAATDPLAQLVA